jgi:hypothetical protein
LKTGQTDQEGGELLMVKKLSGATWIFILNLSSSDVVSKGVITLFANRESLL